MWDFLGLILFSRFFHWSSSGGIFQNNYLNANFYITFTYMYVCTCVHSAMCVCINAKGKEI